jgi:signal transduction histidine kinase/DNA-binding response OmpR family regulator/HPt (histidine-containing phosphotransfer) domain-containing protein
MNGPNANGGTDRVQPVGDSRSWLRRRMQIGLTGRMFLLVVIAVLPALAIQAVNEYTLRSSREDDIRERVIQITKQFGEEMKEVREGASQLLIALGELDEVQAHNGKECRAIFAKLKARFESYAYLGAADANGNVFCSSRSPGLTSIADTEFFKRAFSDNDLAVGNYFVDPISGEKLIHFAHVYRGADGTTGVVFAALDLGWLSEHLKERGLTPSQSILIADRLGNIIARLPHPEQLVGKNMRKSHEAIMDGDVAGWEEAKGVDGLTRIFGYVPAALPPKDFFLSAGQAKSEAFEPIDAATKRGILLILLGLVAATYLAWIGGRKFLQRPIAELLGVTGEWEKGNYDARVKIEDRTTEIGRLGLAFNKMADALATRHAAQQRAEEQLRHLNATLESRIERRTLELEEANRAKSQFLAKMSHEIRTPVNGVLGMLELLIQTKFAPTQRRYIDTARRSAEALLGIINGILDISKIEAGKVELDEANFHLRDLVEEVTETFTDIAYDKGLELTCSVPASLPTAVIGDSGRLRQILTNLIGNAIKFTEKGEVAIRVESLAVDAGSAFVAFEVSDTGIGIPADKQEHIFDAFAQADSSTTRRYGGTGLGLTIAKQLCEMMGGKIELASELGRGSRFRFTARFVRQNVEAPAAVDASPFHGMRALLVKPDTLTRRNLREQLSAWGIRVREAETSTGALAEILAALSSGDPFALVIIDVARPVMNGVALARTIRSDPAMTGLRLLLLAARNQEMDATGDLRGPGVGWLTKPVRQSALRACLEAIDGEAEMAFDASRSRAPVPEGVAGARVLLVEDNPVNLEVAVGILETFGCDVETATNGREALDRYAVDNYGLIFMDCQMPEMDGFQATAEIRRREAQSDRRIPIVALTASAIEGDRERCLAAGMDDYLSKPFTAEQMRSALMTWLGPAAKDNGNGKRDHLTLVPSVPRAVPSAPVPAPVEAGEIEPIDDSVLNALAQLQREGRPDIVNRVITLFLESAPALLKDLEQAAASSDTALLHRASHTLKSASANVGAALLSARCRELEAIARVGAVPDAGARVETIIADYQRAKAALTARLPRVA